MKKIILITIILVMCATLSFAFNWISLPGADSDLMIRGSGGFGHLIVLPVSIVPIGGAVELDIPGLKGVSIGASLGFTVLMATGGVSNIVSTAAYVKCLILDYAEAQEKTGLPFALGTAVGVGRDFTLGISDSASGLGVVYVAYRLWAFTFTSFVGWVDADYGFSFEGVWNITPEMHLSLFYVPLVGIGASFTMDFSIWPGEAEDEDAENET